jgi:hypothetical protein
MRTTIELPDELLARAKRRAALEGIALKQFFIQAIQQALAPKRPKVRRPAPEIGSPGSRSIGILTPERIDEAMFG